MSSEKEHVVYLLERLVDMVRNNASKERIDMVYSTIESHSVSINDQNQKLKAELEQIAKAIHYPDCWDTMAYPTLVDAISEINYCTTCNGGGL